ncbi:MAG: hypothetical protein JO186_10555 [Actinobacteria bacterium]|nr:hypothetical protein [Actinomycetota bacterium]
MVQPDVCVDHRLDLREWHRRRIVRQPRELLDVDVGQELGPGRQELPQLDERRPELFERLAELARALARRRSGADDPELTQDVEDVRAPRGPADLEQPPEAPPASAPG